MEKGGVNEVVSQKINKEFLRQGTREAVEDHIWTRASPFKNKTVAELDSMFRKKGFDPEGPDALNGMGNYLNPKNGRQYHIDPKYFGRYREPNHVDVGRPAKYSGKLGKKCLVIWMINLKEIPCDITNHINSFRGFLNASWPLLDELMKDHNWDDDGSFIGQWLQVNWEFFVERELLEGHGFLTQFSVTYLSDRVTKPEAIANYTVLAKSEKTLIDAKTQAVVPLEKNLKLYCFSTYKDIAYGLYPPFDFARLVIDAEKKLYTVPVKDLKFYLARWSAPHLDRTT